MPARFRDLLNRCAKARCRLPRKPPAWAQIAASRQSDATGCGTASGKLRGLDPGAEDAGDSTTGHCASGLGSWLEYAASNLPER